MLFALSLSCIPVYTLTQGRTHARNSVISRCKGEEDMPCSPASQVPRAAGRKYIEAGALLFTIYTIHFEHGEVPARI